MGRKPNQIVVEFFERGAKLDDASNRYAHTCRSCGEKFPKGRLDTLINHLIRRCPALSEADKRRVVLQNYNLTAQGQDGSVRNTGVLANAHAGHVAATSAGASLPGMSGLEALAEVSRQHLDITGARESRVHVVDLTQRDANGQAMFNPDDFLLHLERASGNITGDQDDADAMDLQSLQAIQNFSRSQPTSPQLQLSEHPVNASSALSLAASAAQELQAQIAAGRSDLPLALALEVASGHEAGAGGLPTSQSDGEAWHNIDPLLQAHPTTTSADPLITRATTTAAANLGRPIALHPSASRRANASALDAKNKSKVRGRFSDMRRKEVQQVRKQGACLRCRMLKKPCSNETPCATCRTVETARLWKKECIRTRIADEFTVWSAGLYTVLSHHRLHQEKAGSTLQKVPGSIVVKLQHKDTESDSEEHMLFSAHLRLPRLDETAALVDPSLTCDKSLVFNNDLEDVFGSIEVFLDTVLEHHINIEPSPMLRKILTTADSIAKQHNDTLLHKALKLFVATNILSGAAEWTIIYDAATEPIRTSRTNTPDPQLSQPSDSSPITDTEPDTPLLSLILTASVDKFASLLGKNCMNELERRLVQRQQSNAFATTLVAVVLLAAAERLCAFFHTCSSTFTVRNFDELSLSSPANTQTWPLDRSPSTFATQGDRFSSILQMLSRMRALPPRTMLNPSTHVSADEMTLLVPAPPSTTTSPTALEDEQASSFLRDLHLTLPWIQERRDATHVPGDARCWDGRFWTRLFLPPELSGPNMGGSGADNGLDPM